MIECSHVFQIMFPIGLGFVGELVFLPQGPELLPASLFHRATLFENGELCCLNGLVLVVQELLDGIF